MRKQNKGVTLIALIITIIVLLILAGISLNLVMGENGIIKKAQIAKENTNYESAKEELQVMLLEIKTRIITEEKRQTKITDLNELDGKEEVTKIEYKSDEIASAEIINVENPRYALVTYRGYIFKIDENLNIIEEANNEIYDEETLNYKKVIAKALTDLGVKTSYTQSSDEYINNIESLADKNYNEGKESYIVLLKSDLSSRYIQNVELNKVEEYGNFCEEDFIIGNKNISWTNVIDGENNINITKSFERQTGILTLGKQKACGNYFTFWNTYDLYAIKRNLQPQITQRLENNSKESLNEFKSKLAKELEKYQIDNEEESTIINKTAEEVSEYINKIAKNKYKEGIATYMVLLQENLNTRYNQTVTVSNIEGYENLTIDDFFIVNKGMTWDAENDWQDVAVMTKNYDSSTGTLELGNQRGCGGMTFSNICDVYLLKKKIVNLEN